MTASDPNEHQNVQRRKQYSRAREQLMLIGLVVSLILGAISALTRLPHVIRRSTKVSRRDLLVNSSLFVIVLSLVQWIATLPLRYYSGYTIEQKYELSNQTPTSWFLEQLKGLMLQIAFIVPVAQVTIKVMRRFPCYWWAVLSAMALPFSVLLAQLFPVVIAPLFNTYQPLQNRALARRLIAMAEEAGVTVDDVYEMDMSRQTKKANAFFAGIGRTKRIVLSDTLLKEFSEDEIAVIVAHEMGHQINGDIWRLIGFGSFMTVGVMAFTAWATNLILARGKNRGNLGQVEILPLISWLASLFGLVLTPVQSAMSRWMERRADTYALDVTQNPDAFASAMERLSETNLADPEPNRVIHMIFHSHPTIRDRVRRAHEYRSAG